MREIIEVRNLTKRFKIKEKKAGLWGSFTSIFNPNYKEISAVEDISFKVMPGELLAFIGPNGAGKSTTIKMLTGILYPTAGKVSVYGLDPSKKRQQLAYHIGSVFGQKPQLWYHLPAIDTFNLYSRIFELEENEFRKRLKFLVEAFEIKDLMHLPVRKLSLGQRMRCEIVASFLHKPKIIFLDEPTIGLDIIAKQHIREVIKYLNEKEKVTIFLTSHDAGDIELLAKRTIIVNYGKIIFDDTTLKLKNNYIKSKIIELVANNNVDNFEFEGGKLIHKEKYSVKLELDISRNSIEALLKYAIENFEIKDVNIFDPPMEKIIASIYHEQKI